MNNLIKIVYPFTYTWLDYPDDCSYALIATCLGCDNNCSGCQNKELQNYNLDEEFNENFKFCSTTVEDFYSALCLGCNKNKTNKVVLSGGDFLFYKNLPFTKELLKINNRYLDICIYTGHTIEYVKQHKIEGFSFIKTGKYDITCKQESVKNDKYFQLASSNQEIYDSNFNLLTYLGRLNF